MVRFGLAPRWSDGSGTGTGGTNDVHVPQSAPDIWMGIWAPQLYVFWHTSNWRELRTLLLTLLPGTTVFYFMDSSTIYHVVNIGP